jgi:hypothetical protein
MCGAGGGEDGEEALEVTRLTEVHAFMSRFDSIQASLFDSLDSEGAVLQRLKAAAVALHRRALSQEATLAVHAQDAALIASLRTRLAEAAGAVEAAEARERNALAELARERAALAAASQRVGELAARVEGLRQMIAAAPRPPRPQLAPEACGGGGGGSPFERWRADAGLVRLEGAPRGKRHSLSPRTLRRLGHVAAVSEGVAVRGAGGGTALLGEGVLQLVPHPFWSPQLYAGGSGGAPPAGEGAPRPAREPPLPPPQHPFLLPPPPSLAAAAAAAAAAPPPPPAPPPPQRLKPLLISHVSNFARHGDTDAQKWGDMLQAERKQLAATLAAVREREEKLQAMRGGGGKGAAAASR